MKKDKVNFKAFSLGMACLLLLNEIHAREVEYPKWYIDEGVRIEVSMAENVLTLRMENESGAVRHVSSSIFDKKYVKSMMLRASFIDFGSPRRISDEFRLLSDGIVGSSSEMYKTHTVDILPGNRKEIQIDIMEALNEVSNQRLKKFLSSDGSVFRLSIKIDMSDVGIEGGCSLRYYLPLMSIGMKNGAATIIKPEQ